MNLSVLTEKDPDVKRRHALANVYEFLLKLAESAKRQPEEPASSSEKEKETITLKENSPP